MTMTTKAKRSLAHEQALASTLCSDAWELPQRCSGTIGGRDEQRQRSRSWVASENEKNRTISNAPCLFGPNELHCNSLD